MCDLCCSLLVGFAVTAWFLSMWISNKATLMLLFPIVESIVSHMETLSEHKDGQHTLETVAINHPSECDKTIKVEPKVDIEQPHSDKYEHLGKALTLTVTYAGKIGGMAMLTGTVPNILMKSYVDE